MAKRRFALMTFLTNIFCFAKNGPGFTKVYLYTFFAVLQISPVLIQAMTVPDFDTIEKIELHGTSRISLEKLTEEIGLQIGDKLDENFVVQAQLRLLGLGLFDEVLLFRKKGSIPGKSILVIEVADDSQVLTTWAIGSKLSVTQGETQVSSGNLEAAPVGYKLETVSRNLFGKLYRGSFVVDLDSKGIMRDSEVGFGLPRLEKEGVQFDTKIMASDVSYRYLDVLGFGGKGEAAWSRQILESTQFQYGIAMFLNREKRFSMPGFPEEVAGPKFGILKETRFKGFVPTRGYSLAASVLVSPTDTQKSVFEIGAARTNQFGLATISIGTNALVIAEGYFATRGEVSFDLHFGPSRNTDAAALFLTLSGGSDKGDGFAFAGSSASIGMKYHSSGFIAELAFKIVRPPKELLPTEISENVRRFE